MYTQLRSHPRAGSRLTLICVAAGLCLASVWLVTAGGAGASPPNRLAFGAVYTQTNDPAGNSVVVFDRFWDGRLRKREAVSTGGNGSFQDVGCGVPGPPADCPILDSQNAVVVAKGRAKFGGENQGDDDDDDDDGDDDRRFTLVFAVNAGSNTVTSFEETSSGLRRVDQVSSGGVMPESLALHGNLLYVLNVATENSNGTTGNIYGLRFNSAGELTPLGSSQPLAHAAPPDRSADPRAIDFKPNGKVIVVTELAGGFNEPGGPPGRINTFVVGTDGKAGPAVSHPSSAPLPFGFAFDHNDHLIVSNITSLAPGAIGTVSSYEVTDAGNVTPIQTVSSGGTLPCWVVISKDDRFAYVVNTGAGAGPALVTHFGLSPAGTLTPLAPPAEHTGDFARTDAALSRDSKFLYVLAPSVGPGPPSHIDAYRRGANGSLTFIGSTPAGANLGVGATGLAAH